MYLGKNNLHGKAMLEKLHVNRFESDETKKVTEDFIWNYKNNKISYFFLIWRAEYPKQLWLSCNELSLLPEKTKISKCEKFIRCSH